jgi:hypothetical protein
MDRAQTNRAALPGVYSDPRLSPTEQDVYATAHLFRALASSQSHNTHNKNPIWAIQDPAASVSELYQLAYINKNRST